MCGIAGGFAFALQSAPVDAGVVRRMNQHQRRRGPDGEGLWTAPDGRVSLGHRRLALIDLSDAGAQPMSDAFGRYVIVFNGEIYNHTALRAELEMAGRRFTTRSDTEVLLNAFAQWGEDCLAKLRGMFAFAIWDAQTREIFLARDPFGIKPLFYAEAGGAFWFASQARALAECAPVDTGRDAAGLVGFYLHGYVPEPFTWWRGVSLLPAGHALRVRAGAAMGKPYAYACVEDMLVEGRSVSYEELRAALRESVASHLIADAPVGVFLSSGVDSTVVAGLAAEAGASLKTVTLAFDEFVGTDNDEAPRAEATAKALGAEHCTIRLSRDAVFGEIDDFFAAMDQPTTDGLNTFLVSRAAAAAGLKAALSGLGGDELFGGYPSFSHIPKMLAVGARVPMRAVLGKFLERLAAPFAATLGVSPKYASVLRYSGSLQSAYFLRRCLHLTRELEMLLDERWRNDGLERLQLACASGLAPKTTHAGVAALELSRYMRNQPLRDADWSSMAHGLEIRTPFLDMPFYRVVAPAIARAAPPTKRDLARMGGALGLAAAGRAKTGFMTPAADWLRASRHVEDSGQRPLARRVAAAFRRLPPALPAAVARA